MLCYVIDGFRLVVINENAVSQLEPYLSTVAEPMKDVKEVLKK